MNKKIKRIKLLKDYHAYNGFDVEIRAGAVSYPEEALQPSTFTFMTNDRKYKSFNIEYLKEHPEWFEIDYEYEARLGWVNKSIMVEISCDCPILNDDKLTEDLIYEIMIRSNLAQHILNFENLKVDKLETV